MACELLLPYKALVTLTRRNAAAELRSSRVTSMGYVTELLSRIFIYESDSMSLTPCQYPLSTYPLISSLVSHAKSTADCPFGSAWPARM